MLFAMIETKYNQTIYSSLKKKRKTEKKKKKLKTWKRQLLHSRITTWYD
jgi:hypothetical protein